MPSGAKQRCQVFREHKFKAHQNITTPELQITVLKSADVCVIGLYRSVQEKHLASVLKDIIPSSGSCLIIGDFNICSMKSPEHEVFSTLKSLGFKQQICGATHFEGGHLDQSWARTKEACETQLYSPYYTCKDHDGLLFTSYELAIENGKW